MSLITDRIAVSAGGGTAIIGGFTANEIATVGGLAVGAMSMVVSLVFKYLHYRLAVKQAKAGLNVDPS